MIQGYKVACDLGNGLYEAGDLVIVDTEQEPKEGKDIIIATVSGLKIAKYQDGKKIAYDSGKETAGAIVGPVVEMRRVLDKSFYNYESSENVEQESGEA